MKIGLPLLVVAALLAATPASASDPRLDRSLTKARACLTQIGALRQTDLFHRHDFAGLMRRMATAIDLAEAWRPHDGAIAVRFAAQAQDCEAGVAAWLRERSPGEPAAAALPVRVELAEVESMGVSPMSGMPPRFQRYVADVMARRVARGGYMMD